MSEPRPDRASVVGRRPSASRRLTVASGILIAVYAVLLAWDAYRHRWSSLAFAGVLIIMLARLLLWPPTVVDQSGIRRPWRRRSFVAWTDVETVAVPQPGFYPVRLNMVDGSTVALNDIAASESAAVAAIGAKSLVRPQPIRLPAPRPALRTYREIEADVARRAHLLAEQRGAMGAESGRLHGNDPT
jgi:hypothetical protein